MLNIKQLIRQEKAYRERREILKSFILEHYDVIVPKFLLKRDTIDCLVGVAVDAWNYGKLIVDIDRWPANKPANPHHNVIWFHPGRDPWKEPGDVVVYAPEEQFKSAVKGLTTDHRAVYGYHALIWAKVDGDTDYFSAREDVEYNTLREYSQGDGGPVVCDRTAISVSMCGM